MSPVSETYLGIPGLLIFWGLFAVATALFAQRLVFLYRLIRLGKNEPRFDNMGRRFWSMFVQVVCQVCNLRTVTRKDLSGLGHAFMFWGFLVALTSYIIFIGLAGFGLVHFVEGTGFETFYLSILDIASLVVMAAVVWAVIRRYVIKPQRLEQSAEAAVILSAIFVLMGLSISLGGFGNAARGIASSWPPIGAAMAAYLNNAGVSQGALEAAYNGIWWAHYIIILGFMAYIPRSKHLHILSSPANVLFKSPARKAVLEPVPCEEGMTCFGVSKIPDLSWKDLLDVNTCAVCGRCHAVCPATLSGKDLSPREMILNIKHHLLEAGPDLLKAGAPVAAAAAATAAAAPADAPATPAAGHKHLVGEVVTEEEIWNCTTCGACQEICPVSVEHPRKIIEFRRHLMLEQCKMSESAQVMLANMQSRGHPWTGVQSIRLRGDWVNEAGLTELAEGETVDTLFWVGCAGALVDRNVTSTLAIAKILQAAGVKFGVLGGAETCCGDPARRVGYDFQYQLMAEQNIVTFNSHGIKEIVTSCPHCYNALKNEYSQFGGNFKVIHHTEFIADLVKQGKLQLTGDLNSKLTYHDPCYLGRYNDVYDEPRRVLQSIPHAELKEMERNRNRSFCCGGGGGHMWIEEQPGTTKINHLRIEEAINTKADTVVSACPYCLQMFEENIEKRGIKDTLKAKDFAEVVAEAIVTK